MNRADRELEAAARLLFRTAGVIVTVVLIGVVGYRILGAPQHGWVDAVYMTLITLTTVGYGEVIDLSSKPAGRLFTMGLLVAGVGSFVYFFSNLTAFLVEGNFDRVLRIRRMKKQVATLENHFIVCGAGSTGRHVIRDLVETHRPLVVIEEDESRLRELTETLGIEFPSVVGDATEDDTLRAARVERAQGLAACIAGDKDNLIVTVSARILNPKLRIICRCIDEKVTDKIHQAGADAVVSPNMIGGLRIVSELVRPQVVTFLDTMLRDEKPGLRVEEFPIEAESELAGRTVGDLRVLREVLVVALRREDRSWVFNPGVDVTIPAGGTIVYIGTPEGRAELEGYVRT